LAFTRALPRLTVNELYEPAKCLIDQWWAVQGSNLWPHPCQVRDE